MGWGAKSRPVSAEKTIRPRDLNAYPGWFGGGRNVESFNLPGNSARLLHRGQLARPFLFCCLPYAYMNKKGLKSLSPKSLILLSFFWCAAEESNL